jgi:hypothetical protein
MPSHPPHCGYQGRAVRQELITSSLFKRITQRSNLLLVFFVGGLFSIFRLVSLEPGFSITELLTPFILLFAHLALSPIPWQWTGNDEIRANLGRGFLQALLFNLLWITLLLALLHLLGVRNAQRPPEPPFPPGIPGFRGMPPPRPFFPPLGFGLINLAFAIAFGWVFAEKEAMEAKEQRTASLLRQSQSRALQSQLEPHVLYNALNSLSELVYEDPLAAEEVIARLADLYRMLAVHGKADLVRLEQERKLVEAYLAMEQMRLGDRLKVQWNWPSWADEVTVLPLLLQPVVENAIKHGISPSDTGGTLVITCSRLVDDFSLSVMNTGCPLVEHPTRGIGLGNLEERLALWPARFHLEKQGEWTIATIRWKARQLT